MAYIQNANIALYATQASGVPYSTVRRVWDAIGRQSYYHWGPWWGMYCNVQPFQYSWQVPSGWIHCTIKARSEDVYIANGGGYHSAAGGLYPFMVVDGQRLLEFPNDATQASHELLEFLGNPYSSYPLGNRRATWIWSPKGYNPQTGQPEYWTNRWLYANYMNEVCDPVWNWNYPIAVTAGVGGGTMLVSDFITPWWWYDDLYGYPVDYLRRLYAGKQMSWYGPEFNYRQAGSQLW